MAPKTQIHLVDEQITNYCESNTTKEPPLCTQIREFSATLPKAHWISGPLVGSFLQILISSTNARDVLDIGTYLGYSAAYAATTNTSVRVTSLEHNPEYVTIANSFISPSPVASQIQIIATDASQWLQECQKLSFDIVFFDSNRSHLLRSYGDLTNVVRPRGILIMDNACLQRNVLEPHRQWELDTVAFNKRISVDERFISTISPIRDGLLIAHRVDDV